MDPDRKRRALFGKPSRIVWAVGIFLVALVLIVGRWVTQPVPYRIAFASSITGPIGFTGQESLVATQIYLDQVNRSGGIDGHPVELVVFDDKSSGAGAIANVPSIAESPCLAVLGHFSSAASLPAGALYKQAKIAAVTGQTAADELTKDNPYYFSAQTPNRYQGAFMADYINALVTSGRSPAASGAPTVDFIYSGDAFGRSLLAGYKQGNGGELPRAWEIASQRELFDASLKAVVEQLAAVPEPRIIVIGSSTDFIGPILLALRRANIHSPIFLGASGASEGIVKGLADDSDDHEASAIFQKLYAFSPLLLDSTGENGLEFAAEYARRTGKRPGWIPAKANDAARLMVEALRRAHPQLTAASKVDDRERVRAALAELTSPAQAVPGLDGPLYFSGTHEMPRPMRLGIFQSGRLISAPLQLVQLENLPTVAVDKEIEKGNVVSVRGKFYWLQRVVYAGIDVNRLNRVDVRDGSFNADVYVWMRYGGKNEDPVQITFPDLKDPKSFVPDKPLEAGIGGDLNYRLYHLAADFKANFDLHRYPFDQQNLIIRFQNTSRPRQQVAYAVDTFGLRVDETSYAHGNPDAFRDIDLWHVAGVRPFVGYISTASTLGKLPLISSNNRIEFAAFDTEIQLRRDAVAFITKSLIPLFLLVLIVFATLFFPYSLVKERCTIPVTGVLTSAVLMISINSQLPPVGYTVAMEYAFYVFFGLCLMAMLSGFTCEILRTRNRQGLSATIDLGVKLTYVTTVIGTVGLYFWFFGRP
ncbi:MAG: ABC transporter substrate-binding protein [Xanthobacteraceae bacterium]